MAKLSLGQKTYVAHESDDAKRLSHDDYIGFAEEATARIVGANPNTLSNHAKSHDGTYATDYDGNGSTAAMSESVPSNPDLVYSTSDYFVGAEAKSSLSECMKKGFVSQIYDLIRLALASDARRRHVILSVPFSGLGEAKRSVTKAMRQLIATGEVGDDGKRILSELLKGRHVCHVSGAGSIALSFDPTLLGDGELCISYCSEVDGKELPSPDGFGADASAQSFEATGYESNSYEDLGGRRYPVMQTTVSVHDDRLQFDSLNNRLIGSDRTPLTQAECYERLLSDGDVDSRNRDAAHQRRRDIVGGLSIHQPVDLFLDRNGNLTIVDGNSRVAEARYLVSHAADGSATGFLRLKAKVFSYETGITREEIDAIKNSRQHEKKVDYDKIQDAFVIYDKRTHHQWDTDRIRSYFGGLYSDRIIDGSVETIRRLKEAGYDDEHIKALYDPMWFLSNAGLGKMGARGYAVSNDDWQSIAKRLVIEKGRVDGGSVEVTKSYLSGSRFSVTVPAIMKATRKSDARKDILRRWLEDDESLSSPDEFIEALRQTTKKRSVREQKMEQIRRAEKEFDSLISFLSAIAYEDEEDVKKEYDLSQRDLKAMHAALTELGKKANMLRVLNKELVA